MEEVLSLLWRAVAVGGMAMGGSWLTVEWILGSFKLKPFWKRIASLLLGGGAVFGIQEMGWITLGADGTSNNYASAAIVSLLSGGLTPHFHDLLRRRAHVLTNSAGPAVPPAEAYYGDSTGGPDGR